MLFPRMVLKAIKPFMKSHEVIVIQGARQVGKTTVMRLLMDKLSPGSFFYMDLEEPRFLDLCEQGYLSVIEYLRLTGVLTDSPFYLFIDEIQYLSNPSSFLKLMHDHQQSIKLIVSGSSSFDIRKKFKDSLVGRTINFELFPLDFEEFTWFKRKKYELAKRVTNRAAIDELKTLFMEYSLYGGYPAVVLSKTIAEKEVRLQQIVDTYIGKDIRHLAEIRAIDKFNKLLRILASQSGSLLNVSELANIVSLSRKTIDDYLLILENTYVIRMLRPFSGNLRSELFKTPKIFFYDSGIMSILKQLQLPKVIDGEIMETVIFSELMKNKKNFSINFWRTKDKKEIDFIIDTGVNTIPIEVKINAHRLNNHALSHFKEKYNVHELYCIALEGEISRKQKQIQLISPWDIHSIL